MSDLASAPETGQAAAGLLTIGVFARRSRLSPKALRLYDRLGLLSPADVDPETGYRRYRETQLADARLIVMLRRLRMPLATVAAVVAEAEPGRAALVAEYWQSVERAHASQRELANHLQIRFSGDEGSYEMFEILEREVPAQVVLTEQRHLRVGELSEWIELAAARLSSAAHRLGGEVGPMFVVYHGEVNEDSDGPVEICLPVDPSRVAKNELPTRLEPAHREVFTRLRKAQVEFPQILSAYDALHHWAVANQRAELAAPREVYFNDFAAAGPLDEVCDIALPIE